jgi:hypothetical protein
MALNDTVFTRSRNGAIVAGTAAVAEASIDLAASSKAARLPISRVVVRSTGTMRIALVAGGPYFSLIANESIDIGAFLPGDAFTLYHIRTGGADVAFTVFIWN